MGSMALRTAEVSMSVLRVRLAATRFQLDDVFACCEVSVGTIGARKGM